VSNVLSLDLEVLVGVVTLTIRGLSLVDNRENVTGTETFVNDLVHLIL